MALHGDLPVRRGIGEGDDSGEITVSFVLAFDNEDKTQTEYDDAGMSGFRPTRIFLH